MRKPILYLYRWLGLLAVGALVWALGNAVDGAPRTVLVIVGATLSACAPFFIVRAALASVGYARLSGGRGVVARWRVSPGEWEAFRHFDAQRSRQATTLINDFRIRPEAAGDGVDVIVGKRQLIVDGSYHVLRTGGVPEMREVRWLGQPPGLECLEFKIAYGRRSGGSLILALRLPVSAAARAEARRTYDHFQALRAKVPSEGLAYRKRKLVVGGGLAVMLLALVASGVGWGMQAAGMDRETSVILIAGGLTCAIMAAIFTGIIALATRGARSGS